MLTGVLVALVSLELLFILVITSMSLIKLLLFLHWLQISPQLMLKGQVLIVGQIPCDHSRAIRLNSLLERDEPLATTSSEVVGSQIRKPVWHSLLQAILLSPILSEADGLVQRRLLSKVTVVGMHSTVGLLRNRDLRLIGVCHLLLRLKPLVVLRRLLLLRWELAFALSSELLLRLVVLGVQILVLYVEVVRKLVVLHSSKVSFPVVPLVIVEERLISYLLLLVLLILSLQALLSLELGRLVLSVSGDSRQLSRMARVFEVRVFQDLLSRESIFGIQTEHPLQ